jgi:hypothetical protein
MHTELELCGPVRQAAIFYTRVASPKPPVSGYQCMAQGGPEIVLTARVVLETLSVSQASIIYTKALTSNEAMSTYQSGVMPGKNLLSVRFLEGQFVSQAAICCTPRPPLISGLCFPSSFASSVIQSSPLKETSKSFFCYLNIERIKKTRNNQAASIHILYNGAIRSPQPPFQPPCTHSSRQL